MASGSCGENPSSRGNSPSKPPSFLVSFLHRRQPSSGKALPTVSPVQGQLGCSDITMAGQFVRNNPGALGELQQNHQDVAPRSPRKSRDEPRSGAQSPTKSALGKLTFRSNTDKETARMAKSRDPSPDKKPKKTKSGTNLVGLLSRPKSLKNLYKLATEEESRTKDKENMTPDVTPVNERPPPIFAQFTSDRAMRQGSSSGNTPIQATKDRPRSFQPPKPHHDLSQSSSPSKTGGRATRPVSLHPGQTPRGKGPFGHGRAKSTATATTPTNTSSELQIDPKDIDQQLEALLDRRNIPENQRYKMRNLADTIKLEFIRQDYAEMQAARADGPGTTGTTGSTSSSEQALVSDPNSPTEDEERPKRSRGRSFTFSRGKKDSSSPAKKSKAEATLGRHFRSRSTDSVASDARPSSSSSFKGSGFLSKIKAQQGPSDYVAYLRKVQKPELVEVGKLHKLRLLLRNETVAWIEDFIQQGGMHEIVGLLNRIMEVEWREEHEDALLHENLLCLKGLATTAKAMEYLNAVQADLFPKLLHMLFDPEKKGPSEFTTRNIITSVLLTYIESAPLVERVIRAKNVLGHLRDKDPEEGQRPLPFVLEMRQERPYRVWCKEVVSVTKEVFWIFLHNLNVVALASDKAARSTAQEGYFASNEDRDGPFGYMLRNFPQERPPVPAAPYVGGVEWDATNYLASHLDLMNAIISCTPSARERNILRAEFRISGWERCLGGSLRICKEKFYGSVHVALRTWVAAAAEDGWDVKDVRFGPPPESRSPKKMGGGQKPKIIEAPPKLEMPKLDFGANQPSKDSWL